MLKRIPNDLVLFISGVSCVGKTSVAHRLLGLIPQFRNITEMDIIRTVSRSIIRDYESLIDIREGAVQQRNNYPMLFMSTKCGDYSLFKKQASFFVNAVREIVIRQQSRRIPTIIEGINIVPSLYFNNNRPIEGFSKNILFVNLYLSDETAHILRREQRCKERGYNHSYEKIKKTVRDIRQFKNEALNQECLHLSKYVNNVLSIDTFDKSIDEVANMILNYISKTYPV